MITKDEITMYTCSYASNTNTCSTNWMLLNRHMNANIHLLMNSFWTLFPDKIFSMTFPWHVSNSLTFPGFPDKWSPCVWCYCKLRRHKWNGCRKQFSQ